MAVHICAKALNAPRLESYRISGDGDALLYRGMGHTIHAFKRNVNMTRSNG